MSHPPFPASAMTGLSRREMLQRVGTGMGSLGLAALLAETEVRGKVS